MYLTPELQFQIRQMLLNSGQLGGEVNQIPATVMFLRSIIHGDNVYTQTKAVMPWFKLRFQLVINYGKQPDALFSGDYAQLKRQRVLERYLETSYRDLESSVKTSSSLQDNVARDLYQVILESFAELKLFFCDRVLYRLRGADYSADETDQLLSFFERDQVDLEVMSALISSKQRLLLLKIKEHINASVHKIREHWRAFDTFSKEYCRYVKCCAYKVLLLVELRSALDFTHHVVPTRRCSPLPSCVVQLAKARVLMFLDQMEFVFSDQMVDLDQLNAYQKLVTQQRGCVQSLLQTNPDKEAEVNRLWSKHTSSLEASEAAVELSNVVVQFKR